MLTDRVFGLHLILPKQRMRAARVGEETRERDLLVGTLLQEQPTLGVEEKHAEGSMEHALFNVAHKMAW